MVFVGILVVAMILVSLWLVGLWNNVLTLVNLILAGFIASSFFENFADFLESALPEKTYLVDYVALWVLFLGSFVFLRICTDFLSRYQLRFHPVVEIIGRTVLSVWVTWVFVCFAAFTIHTAPLPIEGEYVFQASPGTKNFLVGPDRMWLALIQSRSRGALSDFQDAAMMPEYDIPLHPDDGDMNCRVFDPYSEFVFKYRHRRENLAEMESVQVTEQDN